MTAPLHERWDELLDLAGPGAAREVQRGRGLFRRGFVEQCNVAAGFIDGVVRDQHDVFEPRIGVVAATSDAWAQAVTSLAGQVRSVAVLLDRSIDDELEQALCRSTITLVPDLRDVTWQCRCAGICRHVAALHVAFVAQVQRDPRTVLALRGMPADKLIRRLQETHGSPDASVAFDTSLPMDALRGDLQDVIFRPAQPSDPGRRLRHLGEPVGVRDMSGLIGVVERAAGAAWRLAAGDGEEAADVELLLAELRGQRIASAASLASALGLDDSLVAAHLDRLFDDGVVLRTGAGDRARYRAATLRA